MSETHPFISGLWNIHLPQEQSYWFDNGISFGYIPNKYIDSVFLGTFPTYHVANSNHFGNNKAFFYGSSVNSLWPILSVISNRNIHDEQSAFSLLQDANYGMTDIIKQTDRIDARSDDDALTPILFNDMMDLCKHFPNLKTIYVTSGGKSIIRNSSKKSVSKFFRDSLLQNNYTANGFNVYNTVKSVSIYQDELLIKNLKLIALHSPSNNANTSLQGIVNRNATLRDILNSFPKTLSTHSELLKFRVLQWAYHFKNTNFPICEELLSILNKNRITLNQLFI